MTSSLKLGEMFWDIGARAQTFEKVMRQVDQRASGMRQKVDKALGGVDKALQKTGAAGRLHLGKLQGLLGPAGAAFGKFSDMGKQALSTLSAGMKGVGAAAGVMATLVGAAAIAVGAAVAGIGAMSYRLSQDWQKGVNSYIVGTGQMVSANSDVGRSILDIKGSAAGLGASYEQIGSVLAEVNTRTGLTGAALQDVSGQVLTFTRLVGGEAVNNTRLLTRVMGDWGVQSKDTSLLLDVMFQAGQNFGISFDRLAQTVVSFGAPLRQMGFGLGESIAMLGKWEKEGVNVETTLAGLRIAAARFAEKNIDLRDGLRDSFQAIKDAKTESEGLNLAMTVFGSRAGPDMAAAIREGRFELDEAIEAMRNSGATVQEVAEATLTLGDRWAILREKVMTALAPIGEKFIVPLIEKLTEFAETTLPNVLKRLDELVQKAEERTSQLSSVMTEGVARIRFAWDSDWLGIASSVQSAGESLVSIVQSVVAGMQGDWAEHGNSLVIIARSAWGMAVNAMSTLLNIGAKVLRTIAAIMQGDWATAGENLVGIAQTAGEGIRRMVAWGLRGALEVFQIVTKAMGAGWQWTWNKLNEITGSRLDAAVQFIKNAFRFIARTFARGWEAARIATRDALTGVIQAVGHAVANIANRLAELMEKIPGIGGAVAAGLRGVAQGALDHAASAASRITGIFNAISLDNVVSTFDATLGNFTEKIKTFADDTFGDLDRIFNVKFPSGGEPDVIRMLKDARRESEAAASSFDKLNALLAELERAQQDVDLGPGAGEDGAGGGQDRGLRGSESAIQAVESLMDKARKALAEGMAWIDFQLGEGLISMEQALAARASALERFAQAAFQSGFTQEASEAAERVRELREELERITADPVRTAAEAMQELERATQAALSATMTISQVPKLDETLFEAGLQHLEGMRPALVAAFAWLERLYEDIAEMAPKAVAAADVATKALAPIRGLIESITALQEWAREQFSQAPRLDEITIQGAGGGRGVEDRMEQALAILREQVTAVFRFWEAVYKEVEEMAPKGIAAAEMTARVMAPIRALIDGMEALWNMRMGTLDGILARFRQHVPEVFRFLQNVYQDTIDMAPEAMRAAASIEVVLKPIRLLTESMQALWSTQAGRLNGILARFRQHVPEVYRFLQNLNDDTASMREEASTAAASVEVVMKPVKLLAESMQALWNTHGGRLNGILARFRQHVPEVYRFLQRIYDDTEGMREDAEAAAASAEVALKPIRMLAESMQALWNTHGGRLDGVLARFRQHLPEVYRFLQRIYDDTEGMREDAEAAATSVETVLKPISVLAESLQTLYNAERGRLNGVLAHFRRHIPEIYRFLKNVYSDTEGLREDAAAAAASVEEVMRPIGTIVDTLESLYNLNTRGAADAVQKLREPLRAAFAMLNALWGDVKEEAKAAEQAATLSGTLATHLSRSVEFLLTLNTWRRLPDLEERFTHFRMVWDHIIVELGRTTASAEEAAFDKARKWATFVGELADYLKRGMEFLEAVRDYSRAGRDAIDAFLADWWDLVARLYIGFDAELAGRLADEVVRKAAENAGIISAGLKGAMEVLTSVRGWVRVPAESLQDFQLDYQALLSGFADWIYEGQGWMLADEVVRKAAETAKTIADGLLASVGILNQIREYARVPEPAFAAFEADYQRLLVNFANWAQTKGAILADEVVKAVAENARTVIEALQQGAALLADIVKYVKVPDDVFDAFEADYQRVLEGFTDWAREEGARVGEEIVKAVAENAQRIASGLRETAELLKGLVDFSGVGEALERFEFDYRRLLLNFADWALDEGKNIADDLVKAVAENSQRIAAALSDSAETLRGIVGYTGVGGALAAFQADYERLLLQFAEWARDEGAQVGEEAVGEVAENTQRIAEGLNAALQTLLGLNLYVSPALERIEAFVADAALLMREFVNKVVSQFVPESAEAVRVWGEATGAASAGLREGLELLSGLHFYANVAQDRMDVFIDNVDYMMGKVGDLAQRVGRDSIELVRVFGEGISSLVRGLSDALRLFSDLANLDDGTKNFIDEVYTPGESPTSRAAQALAALYNAINNTITTFKNNVIARSGTDWIPAANLFLDAIDRIIAVLRSALSLFVDLDKHGVPDLEKIQALVDAVMALFARMGIDLSALGQQVGAAANSTVQSVKGIQDGLPTAAQAATWTGGVATGLVDGLKSKLTGTIGTDTIQGRALNIENYLGLPGRPTQANAQGWTTGVVTGLVDGLKSKLTGTIGTDTVQGRALSIESYLGLPGRPTQANAQVWTTAIGTGLVDGLKAKLLGTVGTDTVEGRTRSLERTVHDILNSNLPPTATKVELLGKNIGQALADGLVGVKSQVESASLTLAGAIKTPLSFSLEISSPSRWSERFADNVGGTLAGRLAQQGAKVSRASSLLAAALMEPLDSIKLDLAPIGAGTHVTSERRVFADVHVHGDALSPTVAYEVESHLRSWLRNELALGR